MVRDTQAITTYHNEDRVYTLIPTLDTIFISVYIFCNIEVNCPELDLGMGGASYRICLHC
jgi:hypothetical protein